MVMYSDVPKLLKGCTLDFGINHWTEDYIMKINGNSICSASPYGRPVSKVFECSYKDFFEKYKQQNYYIFSKSPLSEIVPTFKSELSIQEEFKQWYNFTSTIFYAGNKGRGALPHIHSTALNLLVSGSKLWILFNANTSGGEKLQKEYYNKYKYKDMIKSSDWLDIEYNTSLKEYKDNGGEVYVFNQEAGDGILIPSNWSHTVINLDECLGITLIEGKEY